MTPGFLGQELDAVFTDIFPDAVKIGMVSSARLIAVIAEKLKAYRAQHIVLTALCADGKIVYGGNRCQRR